MYALRTYLLDTNESSSKEPTLVGSPQKQKKYCLAFLATLFMAKNWVTFASDFSFRPQALEKRTEYRRKTAKFERKFKFRSIKSYLFKMYGWIYEM